MSVQPVLIIASAAFFLFPTKKGRLRNSAPQSSWINSSFELFRVVVGSDAVPPRGTDGNCLTYHTDIFISKGTQFEQMSFVTKSEEF